MSAGDHAASFLLGETHQAAGRETEGQRKRRLAPLAAAHGPKSPFLRQRLLAPSTAGQYDAAAAKFIAAAQRQKWDCSAPEAADRAVEKCLNVFFFKGKLYNVGSLTLCSLCWVMRWSTH